MKFKFILLLMLLAPTMVGYTLIVKKFDTIIPTIIVVGYGAWLDYEAHEICPN